MKTEVAAAAHRVASELFDRLSANVREARRLDLPRTGAELPVVLSAALLVAREEETDVIERLRAEGDVLRELGFELSFSGPWAAYRFMGGAEDHADD